MEEIRQIEAELDRFEAEHDLRRVALGSLTDSGRLHPNRADYCLEHPSAIGEFQRRLVHYTTLCSKIARFHPEVEGASVLHLGCTIPYLGRFLESRGAKVVSLDIDPDILQAGRAIGTKGVIQSDVLATVDGKCRLPVRPGSIDIFVNDHFLFAMFAELNGRDREIFSAAVETMKPGGIAIITRSTLSPQQLERELSEVHGLQCLETKEMFPGKRNTILKVASCVARKP